MADIFTKAKRSAVMSAIRSKGNKSTELKLVSLFRTYGITGWRRHQSIHGRPDFLFRHIRLAIFVDGCFWHGCGKCGHIPKTRREFWARKITRNKIRDRKTSVILRKKGYMVARVWEHELKKPVRISKNILRMLQLIGKKNSIPLIKRKISRPSK